MSLAIVLLALAASFVASAAYSGAEIGFYSLSRARVDLEARSGSRTARLTRRLLANDSALLVTILIGNNLALELATHSADVLVLRAGVPERARELVLVGALTPVLFFFGEVFPKTLFRRRPHALVDRVVPFIVLSRWLFLPLERFLRLLSAGLERLLGLAPELVTAYHGREAVLGFLAEGQRAGVLSPRAAELAQNALELRTIPVARAMLPWASVQTLSAGDPEELRAARVRDSQFSRLPVVSPEGRVLGYVHQLDVLAKAGTSSVLDHLRPLPELPEDTPVDRALAKLRVSGQRIAVVGSADAPRGLLTLKDLVEEISGDLAVW